TMSAVSHFCVNCGRPLELREIEGRQVEACPVDDFVLWRDPKVVTMVVVESGQGLWLGRRGIEPGYGLWCLPGGFGNDDEHPAESAARECIEEIGAEVAIGEILGVYHSRRTDRQGMVAIAYSGRVVDPSRIAAGSEMLEVVVTPWDEAPELVFPMHRQAMNDWRRRRESSS